MNATERDTFYWQQRAWSGDGCCDGEGNCLGCGRDAMLIADGAAEGCIVCLAFLDWANGKAPECWGCREAAKP